MAEEKKPAAKLQQQRKRQLPNLVRKTLQRVRKTVQKAEQRQKR